MIRASTLTGFKALYHRNGVSGEPFHVCHFLERGRHGWLNLTAVVFDEPGHVAVTSRDPLERFRGDHYEPALRQLIKEQEVRQPMAAHIR